MSPKIIFIVPYRDRKEHKQFFMKYMEFVMEDYKKDDYEIFFAQQCDSRPFNRGAMKNIGFIAIKNKYPNEYKNITFVFNDVDTLPYTKNLLNYETRTNIIKHFYGYTMALGGIFSIKGSDFEKINGFPNMWGWSMEDNMIQERAINNGIIIDRSNFYPIGSRSILQFVDGIKKNIAKKEIAGFLNKNYNHGLNSIRNLKLNCVNEFININHFNSETDFSSQIYQEHDTTKPGSQKIRLTHKERYGDPAQSNNNAVSMFNFAVSKRR
jgi:hypothetical protein